VTLSAFAAERRAAAPLLQSAPAAGTRHRRPQLSIDISCPNGAQQQTRQPPLLLSIHGTDRRTDRQMDARPLHNLIPQTMRTVSINYSRNTNDDFFRGENVDSAVGQNSPFSIVKRSGC